MTRRSIYVLTALLCLTSSGAAQDGPTMEVAIPVHPSAVPGDGQVHLVYELHLTNWTRAGQVLRRVLVLDPRSGRTLRGYEGDALKSGMVIVGADRSNVPDELASAGVEIPPGRLVYLWLSVAPEDAPSSLSHRVLYEQSLPDSTTEVVELETSEIGLGPPPVVISPPLRGDNWLATSFGRQERRAHSRLVFTSRGRATIAQRFAVDWGRFVGGPGVTISQSFRFPGVEGNEGARSWGEEVLAVADGVVAAVTAGIPDNVGPERAVEITTETAGGNSVLLDIGSGHLAYYAHLQEESLRVSPGDIVKVGGGIGAHRQWWQLGCSAPPFPDILGRQGAVGRRGSSIRDRPV